MDERMKNCCLIHKEIYIIFNNFNKFWNMGSH